MFLRSLHLTNFKNHEIASFEFGEQINCIVGKNGAGKTNLLDAIYYLSFTKSALGTQDRLTISHNNQVFTIFGTYSDFRVAIQFEKGKVKLLKVDGKEPERLSDVIGKVPLVMVLPDDTVMIREGSEERRKFFDGILSQLDRVYLESLLKYNKLLKQRNTLLKQGEASAIDYKLVETFDDQLIPLAKGISGQRAELLNIFLPFMKKNYASLHEEEIPALKFKSHVEEGFESLFRNNFQRDQLMQHTLLGSHRDDVEFALDGVPIKKFGSQGQQKTFIIALKLAMYDLLNEQKKKRPLFLLDDIFDKLDDHRIQLLVNVLTDHKRFGQVFITDAREDRSKKLFKSLKNVRFIEIPGDSK